MSNHNYHQNGAGEPGQTAVAEPAGGYGRNELRGIRVMLEALLKSQNHIHWIGGYVYGETSNGDPFIILYPAADYLNEKVCRVYPHDFKKLPRFIPTNIDGGDVEGNPSKDKAQKKGIYHECPLFQIVTYDGKETQMGPEKRFGGVVQVSREAAQALPQQTVVTRQPQTNTPPPPPSDPNPHYASDRPATLPDYRVLAGRATQRNEFDYAAFMALKNGLYTEQSHIASTVDMLAEYLGNNWRLDGGILNAAMMAALETYRDERNALELAGKETAVAHKQAKSKAAGAYRKTLEPS